MALVEGIVVKFDFKAKPLPNAPAIDHCLTNNLVNFFRASVYRVFEENSRFAGIDIPFAIQWIANHMTLSSVKLAVQEKLVGSLRSWLSRSLGG